MYIPQVGRDGGQQSGQSPVGAAEGHGERNVQKLQIINQLRLRCPKIYVLFVKLSLHREGAVKSQTRADIPDIFHSARLHIGIHHCVVASHQCKLRIVHVCIHRSPGVIASLVSFKVSTSKLGLQVH